MRVRTVLALTLPLLTAPSCGDATAADPDEGTAATEEPMQEPSEVTVQHLLIAFQGRIPEVTRSEDDAQQLARQLLARARDGEDFGVLVREYSDDPVEPDDPTPGVYRLLQEGATERTAQDLREELEADYEAYAADLTARFERGELSEERSIELARARMEELKVRFRSASDLPHRRSGMVPGFGNVAFRLEVGEIRMLPWHYRDSPYGWHVLKRLE